MEKSRTEAFTDAVIAIGHDDFSTECKSWLTFADLVVLKDIFFRLMSLVLSSMAYWSNHHHIFQMVEKSERT